MAEQEELGRFLVGLSGKITNNVTRGLQNLLTLITAQGIYQVMGSCDGEPTKFRDWIRSIEKYMLLAGGDDNNQKGLFTR